MYCYDCGYRGKQKDSDYGIRYRCPKCGGWEYQISLKEYKGEKGYVPSN